MSTGPDDIWGVLFQNRLPPKRFSPEIRLIFNFCRQCTRMRPTNQLQCNVEARSRIDDYRDFPNGETDRTVPITKQMFTRDSSLGIFWIVWDHMEERYMWTDILFPFALFHSTRDVRRDICFARRKRRGISQSFPIHYSLLHFQHARQLIVIVFTKVYLSRHFRRNDSIYQLYQFSYDVVQLIDHSLEFRS